MEEYATVLPADRTMCASSRTVVVLPLVPVTETTGIVRVGDLGLLARLDRRDPCGRLGEEPVDRTTTAHLVQERRHLAPERLGRAAPPPRERDDDLVGFGTRAAPDREPHAGSRSRAAT